MITNSCRNESANLFKSAWRMHKSGRLEEAKRLYQSVLKLNPDHFAATYALAMLTNMQDEPFQAIQLLQKTLETNPGYSDAWCKLGQILLDNNLDNEAVKALSQAARLDPQHSGALFGCGLSCFAKGKIEPAIIALKNLSQLQPDIAEVSYSLGLIYLSQKDLVTAEKSFKKAIELRHGYPEAHKNLGVVLLESNRLEESVASLENAVTLDPECQEAFRFLGDIYRDLGEFDKAINAYLSEQALAPNRIDSQIDIGLTYLRKGEFVAAREVFVNIIEQDPGIAEVHYNLGLVCQKELRYEQAVDAYRNALIINPRNTGAHNNLAMVLDLLGRKSEAIDHYKEILKIDPDNHGVRHILAALSGEQLKTANPEYVIHLFDQYSDEFEFELINALKYTIPTQLKESVEKNIEGDVNFYNALDLGCGTGMCGQEFWGVATKITGVDLSTKMLGRAARKGVYHALVNRDIVQYLEESKDYFDLFIAADVFIYVGDLGSVFKAVQNRSIPGGYFTFSVERCNGNSYWLCPSGRYAHSRDYINNLAALNSFSVEKCTPTGIRLENDNWIEGDIYILKSYKLLPVQPSKWIDIAAENQLRQLPPIPILQ